MVALYQLLRLSIRELHENKSAFREIDRNREEVVVYDFKLFTDTRRQGTAENHRISHFG
jgi:hypothetical protein